MWAWARAYYAWNFTTICCYRHKCNCESCPNELVCDKYSHWFKPNGMHPIKYATLNTLRNIGAPNMNGYKRAEMEYERAREDAGCTCEPKIIRAEKAYEPDGYSMEYTYNCEECGNEECEYWKEYN